MPTGPYFTADSTVTAAYASTFIPEIWSDEIIADYNKSLKMAPLVKRMSLKGKKGDTVHIPRPVDGVATAKAAATAVTIQANTELERVLTINRHFEYSRLIEDIVDVQAQSSLRRFYTSDAGYQLARRVDTDLINVATGWGNGTYTATPAATGANWIHNRSFYVDAANGLAAYDDDTVTAGDNFTDLAFRQAIKILDDADVPMSERYLLIPPVARKDIMGIERYVSSDFRDPRTVQSGLIGSIYGVDVYVSTNAPVIETAANNSVSTADVRGCLFFHKEAILLGEQMSVRSQTQYKQEYLATLFTADTLYGVLAMRPEAGVVIAVSDA
jgi:N4-gp56 family major capsid protein